MVHEMHSHNQLTHRPPVRLCAFYMEYYFYLSKALMCVLLVCATERLFLYNIYRKHTAILISIEIILIKKYLCSCDWSGARQAKSMHTTVWRCCSLHQHPYCEIPIIINSFCIFFLFFSSITLAEYILKIDYIFFHACNTAPQHQQK